MARGTEEPPVVEVRRAAIRRGGELLLEDLSWLVRPGEHWAILGPNGAGKTLLMRLLTGYLWPSEGSVDILGQRLGTVDVRQLRRSLGWVAKALEEMTPAEASVREVLLSGPEATLGFYGESQRSLEEQALSMARDYGLESLLKRPFGLLSSGEKQRALLARALMAQPRLLFLDEPMSNLDLGGRELFLELLTRLTAQENPPTIIMSTHNTLEIGPCFSHALLLKKGRLVASGSLDETMRPEPLAQAFELPLKVERTASGRYLACL